MKFINWERKGNFNIKMLDTIIDVCWLW